MGGAVSSGRDNNELIDNLMSGNYIRTREVERVFRALDRAEYMTPEARDQAYKDLAWRNGPLHLSSPCIYSEVMEGLELKPGLSFLNVGSGTGYLSTLAGLILGTAGISHGVEVHPAVVEYAVKKIHLFFENSPILDDFDFCEPKFYHGNGLCLGQLQSGYDRVYCGAGCPEEYENYFKRLIKVGGILVMPLNDTLLQVRRVAEDKWTSRSLLNVSFATLRVPTAEEAINHVKLDKQTPVRLQYLARAVVRTAMRGGVTRRHPILREAPRAPPPATCPRRICIPLEAGGAVEGLNVLHDLDSENGANEMNALLSLVISMGQSRVAGALRFDRITPSDSSDDEQDNQDQPDDLQYYHNNVPQNLLHSNADLNLLNNNAGLDIVRLGNIRPNNNRPDNIRPDNMRPGNDNHHEKSCNGPRDDPSPRRGNTEESNEMPDEPNLTETETYADTQERNSTALGSAGSPANNLDNNHRSRNNSTDDSKLGNSRKSGRQRLLYSHPRDPLLMALCETGSKPSTSCDKLQSASVDVQHSSDTNPAEAADSSTTTVHDPNGVPPRPDLPGMPSEVEIDLGKMAQTEASTSTAEMEWEETRADTLEASEDETETSKSKPKRQKLDSGIGENTPSGSSPDKTKSENSDSESHSCPTEEPANDTVSDGENRLGGSSPDRTNSDASDSESPIDSDSHTDDTEGFLVDNPRERSPPYWEPSPEELAHQEFVRRRMAQGGDARRVRLSYLMKQAVRELPLPHALKKFVNLGRCFEF